MLSRKQVLVIYKCILENYFKQLANNTFKRSDLRRICMLKKRLKVMTYLPATAFYMYIYNNTKVKTIITNTTAHSELSVKPTLIKI